MVTGVVPSPPRCLPSGFIAHRVQQSHCSSTSHRVLLTHALALSAGQFVTLDACYYKRCTTVLPRFLNLSVQDLSQKPILEKKNRASTGMKVPWPRYEIRTTCKGKNGVFFPGDFGLRNPVSFRIFFRQK